jgi:hypothetical protein
VIKNIKKMCKKILNIIFLLLLSSCLSFNFNNGDEPRKKAFKYYNKKFQLDSNCKLKIDKHYINIDDSNNKVTEIITFFKDGYLNEYSIVNYSGSYLPRRNEGVDLGYFKTKSDSLFFSTKSYYNKKERYYSGYIYENYIILSSWKLNWKKEKINIIKNQVYTLQ